MCYRLNNDQIFLKMSSINSVIAIIPACAHNFVRCFISQRHIRRNSKLNNFYVVTLIKIEFSIFIKYVQ